MNFFSWWPLLLSITLLRIIIFLYVKMLAIDSCLLRLTMLPTMLTHLSSLDVGKLTGSDQLSSRFLKEVAGEVVVPLTNLFNYSLQHTVVPLAWKRSHITPVFKGGAPNDPSNYRPIAQCCPCGR